MVPETTTQCERDGEQTTFKTQEEFDIVSKLEASMKALRDDCVYVNVGKGFFVAVFDGDGEIQAPDGYNIETVKMMHNRGGNRVRVTFRKGYDE